MQADSNNVILGQEHIFKMLDVAVDNDMPALLIGDTGVGKTSIVRELAGKHQRQVVRFSMTGETTVDEFLGKYTLAGGATVWEDGVLLQTIKKGHWLVVDEVNVALPEILFVLHSLLDDDKQVMVAPHKGEVVKPHEHFRFFATMNPVEEYSGTKDLNKAFKSRFNMVLQVSYPAPDIEMKIIYERTGIPKQDAAKIVDVATQIRQAKSKDELFYTCSTRDLLHWGNLVKPLGFDDAFKVTVFNKSEEDAPKVEKLYQGVTGRHLQLENKGYTLLIDWFEQQATVLDKLNKEVADKKEAIRKKIESNVSQKVMATKTKPTAKAKKPAAKVVPVADADVVLEDLPF